MNSKVKKAGLVVSIIIVVIILVDLLFNLSGVLSERFQNSNTNNSTNNSSDNSSELENRFNSALQNSNIEYSQEDIDRNAQIIKSVESIFSTARYNVVALPFNASTVPTTSINIKSDSFNSLSVSNDIISRVPSDYSDNAQTFKLVKMNNMRDVAKFIGQGVYVPALDEEFPYYFIKAPGVSNRVLHVGDSELSLVKPSNRTNQRFKGHTESHQSLKTGIGDVVDIKIKLDQNSINSIISKLGIPDLNNTAREFHSNDDENCNLDNWIPRDAVQSMCGYCDPDLID